MIDPRLPLMIRQPNVLAALDAGTAAAGNQANVLRQAEGQNLFRQHGAGAMRGDPTAMNALAGFDPVMAQNMQAGQLDMQSTRQNMAIAQEELQMVRAETARAVQAAQDKAEAESQVRMMERAFRAMDVGMRTGDMRSVTQGLSMFGLQDLDPETGMQLAAQMVAGGVEGLAQSYLPQQTEFGFNNGFFYDKNNPQAGARPIPGMPADQPLVDMSGMVVGDQGPGVTDKFYEKLDTGSADMFMGLLNNGMTVPSRLGQLNQMESLLSAAPEGASGALRAFAGNLGLQTEGLSELQAAQALINRLVPSQRPPGSGPMSDADLELFKQSLPRLVNTREGNARIIQTLRGIAEYEAKQAEIAERVATRQITPAQGMQELRTLENPLAGIKSERDATRAAREVEINGQRFRVEPLDE